MSVRVRVTQITDLDLRLKLLCMGVNLNAADDICGFSPSSELH